MNELEPVYGFQLKCDLVGIENDVQQDEIYDIIIEFLETNGFFMGGGGDYTYIDTIIGKTLEDGNSSISLSDEERIKIINFIITIPNLNNIYVSKLFDLNSDEEPTELHKVKNYVLQINADLNIEHTDEFDDFLDCLLEYIDENKLLTSGHGNLNDKTYSFIVDGENITIESRNDLINFLKTLPQLKNIKVSGLLDSNIVPIDDITDFELI